MGGSGTGSDDLIDTIAEFAYPAIRLVVAASIVWYSRVSSSNPRFFSGLLSAALAGFFTFTFLEPLFTPVGLDLANVALWVLALYSSMVGMSLGVLLPAFCPGLCFGASTGLLVGCHLGMVNTLYCPIVCGTAALIGAVVSSR
ncbi:MAG: hypothetical protein SGBAC_000052 [Bacillariaceae sp.]